MGNIYGYVRVSDVGQNERRQVDALLAWGVLRTDIFIDKKSGADFNRPAYRQLIKKLKSGDLLCISSLDRLGRSYAENHEQWRILTREKQVDIVVLDMPILDTRQQKNLTGTLISDLVITLLSYVAQSEREHIKSRQAQGIASAKARGIHLGRPNKGVPLCFSNIARRWKDGHISLEQALHECGMSRATFFRRWREYNNTPHS